MAIGFFSLGPRMVEQMDDMWFVCNVPAVTGIDFLQIAILQDKSTQVCSYVVPYRFAFNFLTPSVSLSSTCSRSLVGHSSRFFPPSRTSQVCSLSRCLSFPPRFIRFGRAIFAGRSFPRSVTSPYSAHFAAPNASHPLP